MKTVHVGIGGGVTSIIRSLVRGLPEHPTTVLYFGPLTGPLDAPDVPGANLTWIGGWNIFGYLSATARLASSLRQRTPDVVFLHGFIPVLFGTLPAALAGVRHVIAVDHGPQLTYRWLKRLLLRLIAPWVTDVVSVSQSSADWFRAEYRFIPARKVRVIENGIDLAPFAAVSPRGLAQPPYLISMISRMDRPQKDPQTLVRAAALLRDRGLPIRVRLVGSGNLMTELGRLIDELRLTAQVELAGFDANVTAQLRQTDIVVLSTHWEGLPLGLIEAMAAGLPVVASRVVGVTTVLTDGRTGQLVPENNADALAEALASLIANPEQARELGRAAQVEARKRFSVERMLARYRVLLTELTRTGQS